MWQEEERSVFALKKNMEVSISRIYHYSYIYYAVAFHNVRKYLFLALTGVAQWVDHPANQKVAGSIPSQGTCLGCGPGPQLGVHERQLIDVSFAHQYFSPSFSLPCPLSKKK